MPVTKAIFGPGRIPLPSEFTEGQIIINVDDSRVFSKNKQNNVFEISPPGVGIATASIHSPWPVRDFIITSSKDSNFLILSASTGIRLQQGLQPNSITIEATGEAIVELADTASYFDGVLDINTQTNLLDGDGLTFDGNTLNVDDIFLRSDQNDSTNFNLTAQQFIATSIVKLSAKTNYPAVEGGLLYSSSNEFYLGFS